jgi:eukaryotic-like serine/threonine-protein kinase
MNARCKIDAHHMVLAPGTQLGPYEIESLIGSGGMGEVYKARDRRLNRTVAIKRMIADDNNRFQSEARTIAAINHPHICQIYDIGHDYLVLEKARARQLIMEMGDSPVPLWGRVVYHLLTLDLDAAADWYDRMIEHRDPFALVYARAPFAEPLRGHPRWPELAARMKLPAVAT